MGDLAQMLRDSGRLEWLRVLGAAVLTTGIFLLQARQGGDWDSFVLFLIAAVFSAALYLVALAVAEAGVPLERWQTGLMIGGLLLAFLALGQLAEVLGADSGSPGTVFWVTGLLTLATAAIAVRYRSPIHTLIAALIFVVCFVNLVQWLGDEDLSIGGLRNIMAGFFIVYVGLGLTVRRRAPDAGSNDMHGHYLVLVGSVAGVIAGTIGASSFDSDLGSTVGTLLGLVFSTEGAGEGSDLWALVLLVVSLLAIGYSWKRSYRGTAYVGVIGLAAFVAVNAVDGGVWAWPLLLILAGIATLAASVLVGRQAGQPSEAREPHE